MDSKDPPPFGYTFDPDFFNAASGLANNGHELLSETENQGLADFFNQDIFSTEQPTFTAHNDSRDPFDNFSSATWDFVPPPQVHGVSATIPDQAVLHQGNHVGQSHAANALPSAHLASTSSNHVSNASNNDHMTSTQDELQAASALFYNAHASAAAPLPISAPQLNGRSYSVPQLHTASTTSGTIGTSSFSHQPMVSTAHGLLNEQLAALLPNHSDPGSIDSQVGALFSQVSQTPLAEDDVKYQVKPHPKPNLKRAYTYGTDNDFGDNYMGPPAPEEDQRMMFDFVPAKPRTKSVVRAAKVPPSTSLNHLPIQLERLSDDDDDDEPSEDEDSNDDDEDGPAKKRRKSKNGVAKAVDKRKSVSGRSGKGRKGSLFDESTGKKKRPSSAGQKMHRENLTEEQKRNNHILSEQKRRNLIKRGFDDLHDLVPEIRNGGLSKSSVLTEAANFLDMLIRDNARHAAILEAAGG